MIFRKAKERKSCETGVITASLCMRLQTTVSDIRTISANSEDKNGIAAVMTVYKTMMGVNNQPTAKRKHMALGFLLFYDTKTSDRPKPA